MIPVPNNFWNTDKNQSYLEDITNTSVILTDLFYCKTELYHDYIVTWYSTGITGKIQLPYVNKLYTNTSIDDQMHCKMELKPLQDVILKENDWLEEKLYSAKHQVIYMLNSSTQVYHKVQIIIDQSRK